MGNESESNIGLINDDQSIANYRPPSQKKGIIIISSLGVIFMLLFSAYNTAQNMISQIYSQNLKLSYLGRLTLLFIYLFLGFSNILAGLQKIEKSKKFIIAFSFCYLCFFEFYLTFFFYFFLLALHLIETKNHSSICLIFVIMHI